MIIKSHLIIYSHLIIKSHLIYNDNYDNYDNYIPRHQSCSKLPRIATDQAVFFLQVQAALQKLRCVVSERFVVPRVCRGVEDLG